MPRELMTAFSLDEAFADRGTLAAVSDQQLLHVIYDGAKVLLSKRHWSSWGEIQSAFADYRTSLGAWSSVELTAFLQDEFVDLEPSAADHVRLLETSSADARHVDLCERVSGPKVRLQVETALRGLRLERGPATVAWSCSGV